MPTLEEVKSNRPCQISDSLDSFLVCELDRHGKYLRNVINKESGLIFVDPVPFENTEDFYKQDYRKTYKGVEQPKNKHIYRAGRVALGRYSKIKKFLNKNSVVLDAGSSSGEFIYLLKKKGVTVEGIEANQPYANYSKSTFDVDVSVCPFSKFDSKRKFDLITMFHVLEHLENPLDDLRYLSSNLTEDGRFVIEVPNILYQDMSFKNKWHKGHLFSFTEHSLPLLMNKVGLDTVKCGPIGDGANLWGEFKKKESDLGNKDPNAANAETIIKELFDARSSYFLRIRNYLKFLTKISRLAKEYWNVKNMKCGKEILDSIY